MEDRTDFRLQKVKEALHDFSDTNGGIKFEYAPAFYEFMDRRTKPTYIKEAAPLLHKSKLEVLRRFFENDGWELINKWLIKMSQVRKASDKEIAPGIQKLIFRILGKWLSESGNVLPESTIGIIDSYSSEDKKTQKIIKDFRSKWKIGSHTSPDSQKDVPMHSQASVPLIPTIDDQPIARRLRNKNIQRQSEIQQENENTSSPKQSRTVKKGVSGTPTRENALEPVISHQSENEILATKQENEASAPHELTQLNSSRSDLIATDHSHRSNEPFDMGNGSDSYTYYRRVDIIKRNEDGPDFDMEQTNYLNMCLTINMPGSVQNHFYV